MRRRLVYDKLSYDGAAEAQLRDDAMIAEPAAKKQQSRAFSRWAYAEAARFDCCYWPLFTRRLSAGPRRTSAMRGACTLMMLIGQ